MQAALGEVERALQRLVDARVTVAALPPDPRPLPSVAAYDQLLRHTRSSAGRPTS